MFEALKAAVEERMRLARDADLRPEAKWYTVADLTSLSDAPLIVLPQDAPLIAANDPAFVIRSCERDLDLLRRYTEELAESEGRMTRDEIWEHYGRMELLRELVDSLAEVYQINLGVSE